MEPDVWFKDCGEHHEHVAAHVDDLLMYFKEPHGAVDALTNKHHLKFKGKHPMSYHLECYFGRDGHRIIHFSPRKHAEKMEDYC